MRTRGRQQHQQCSGRDCNRRMGQFLDPALLPRLGTPGAGHVGIGGGRHRRGRE